MSSGLKSYRSHKQVVAAKIEEAMYKGDGSAIILPAGVKDANGKFRAADTIRTNPGWMNRVDTTVEDPGYYVQYEDGFESWSPTAAFESGYKAEKLEAEAPAVNGQATERQIEATSLRDLVAKLEKKHGAGPEPEIEVVEIDEEASDTILSLLMPFLPEEERDKITQERTAAVRARAVRMDAKKQAEDCDNREPAPPQQEAASPEEGPRLPPEILEQFAEAIADGLVQRGIVRRRGDAPRKKAETGVERRDYIQRQWDVVDQSREFGAAFASVMADFIRLQDATNYEGHPAEKSGLQLEDFEQLLNDIRGFMAEAVKYYLSGEDNEYDLWPNLNPDTQALLVKAGIFEKGRMAALCSLNKESSSKEGE